MLHIAHKMAVVFNQDIDFALNYHDLSIVELISVTLFTGKPFHLKLFPYHYCVTLNLCLLSLQLLICDVM